MRLDVADPGAFGAADAVQRADLVEQHVLDFLGAAGHRAAAEADQVGVGGVGADAHLVLHRQGHGAAHDRGVGGVEAAGDVGAVDVRHDLGIEAHGPGAEAFADIAVEEQATHGWVPLIVIGG
ncbi:hypothetical protein D3C80_1009720 [compost metagenome]